MGIFKNHNLENCGSEAIPQGGVPLEGGRFLRGESRGNCFIRCLDSRVLVSLALMLVCLTAPAAATAAELGRLFFTPQQRQDLERRRASNRAQEKAPQIKKGSLTLDGHVRRSSGRNTTWINGAPQFDSHAGHDPARVTVVPNAGAPGVSLKVGQTYERASGKLRDSLQGGEITIGKSTRPARTATRRGGAAKALAPDR